MMIPNDNAPTPANISPEMSEDMTTGAMNPAQPTKELQVFGADQEPESDSIVSALEAHLDQLQEQDKTFLAEHLTPEFVRAIGLINGPEVAQYLNQFVNPDKVLVPVPRAVAEQYLAEQKGQVPATNQAGPQTPPQAPPMAPQAPQGQPQGGMMAPVQ